MATALRFVFLVFSILLYSSCAKNKYFYKNNQFTTLRDSPRPDPNSGGGMTEAPDTLIHFSAKSGFKGKFKEFDGYITIEPKNASLPIFADTTVRLLIPPVGKEVAYNTLVDLLKNKIFVPDIVTPGAQQDLKVKYFDSRPVLQTLSTPIKIRPKLTNPALKDSFPSQVSTGVNLGIAFGWKLSQNYFRPTPNVFGLKITQISLTPGLFYGLGATSLTKANTRNPVIAIERSTLSQTIGGFAMLGFNNINIGYSIGWDFASGTNKSSWLYQGRVWHGVAISLDLIK